MIRLQYIKQKHILLYVYFIIGSFNISCPLGENQFTDRETLEAKP
jgi:hypothetical protein